MAKTILFSCNEDILKNQNHNHNFKSTVIRVFLSGIKFTPLLKPKLFIMKRSSSVTWHGSGKEGSGKITTQSKVISSAPYKYATRFGEEKGINPEELIAAAHASCFTMKLSFVLGE